MVALPIRLFRAIPPMSSFKHPSLQAFKFPTSASIFKPVHATPTAALAAITSPYVLTRREMLASRKALAVARDDLARRIGALASQGPQITAQAGLRLQAYSSQELQAENARLCSVLCSVLDVPTPPHNPTPRRSKASISHTPPAAPPTPGLLLSLLSTHLARTKKANEGVLAVHKRPGALTRLWFPLLFLPPTIYYTAQAVSRNKDWAKEQVMNARETVRGFVIQWVWEPLEGIGKTLRGGGEGLGVAPTTVQSDQAVCPLIAARVRKKADSSRWKGWWWIWEGITTIWMGPS